MTGDNHPPARHSARVLNFRRGQDGRLTGGLTSMRRPPAGPVPDLAKYEHANYDGPYTLGHGDDEYRHRMLVNLAAFIVVVGLIFAGYWLADTMARMRKNQDCVLSGRRGCTPVTVIPKDRW